MGILNISAATVLIIVGILIVLLIIKLKPSINMMTYSYWSE